LGTVLVALLLLAAGGIGSLAAFSRPRLATLLGSGGCAVACALGLFAVLSSLRAPPPSLRLPWPVPYGAIALEVDPLSSLFLLIIFGLCLLAAVYGAAYLTHDTRRSTGPAWLFFNLLVASMALVVMARNGVLFLMAWEGMALSSFFLVTFEDEKGSVREAGRIYLIASHAGTAFLLALFVALAAATGSMDFDRWRAAADLASPASAGLLFLLALVGFGTKAGLVPFHVWLPEAHPAAPSHVSAVMSGVMIKMGIYGLLRALTFLGPPPPWWGAALLGLGVVSALVGVLFALVQQDIKRLLAYSSVENVGLIAIGLGLGMIGRSYGLPILATLGFAGGLLHVMNHALFKGVLFLGAGAIAQQTGTRQIERLGGVLKKMPITGACLLAGSAAITALPPFNGFAGEFVLTLGSLQGIMGLSGARGLLPLAALVGLALTGSLAAACFLRFSGLSLLGLPRDDTCSVVKDPPAAMQISMVALAALCLILGLAPGLPLRIVEPAVAAAMPGVLAAADFSSPLGLIGRIPRVFALLILLVGVLVWFRRSLLSGRDVSVGVTWDCGYEQPTSRMQYTASSFGEPIREMFGMLLPARRRVVRPEGYFPAAASFESEIVRPFQERLYGPAFEAVHRGMSRLRWLHHGRAQLYVLYIVVTLILMLAWFLASGKAPL
jgi:formate hydrogenlyase subunit 3/multisubunit Na+/H+ antiporter MnhD subunit